MRAGSLSSQSDKLKQLLSVKRQELEAAQRLNTALKQRQDVLLASIQQLGAGVSAFATLQHQLPGHQITGATTGGVTDQPSVSPAFAPEDSPFACHIDALEILLHQTLLQADATAAPPQPAAGGGGHCSPGGLGSQLSCTASSPNPWASNPQPATEALADTTAAPQRPSTALMDDLAAREQGIAAQLHLLAAGTTCPSDRPYTSRQLASLAANPLRARQLLSLPAQQRLAELRRWVRQLSLLLPRYDAVQAAPGSGAALPGWSGWSARQQADQVVDCLVEALLAWGLLDKPGALLRLLGIDMEAEQPCNSSVHGWWTHVAATLQLSHEQRATLAASWHKVKADTAALLQEHDLLAEELVQLHKHHCHSLDQFGQRLHACFVRGRSHWWQEQGNEPLHLITSQQPEQTGMQLQQLAEHIFLQHQQPLPEAAAQQQQRPQWSQQQHQPLAAAAQQQQQQPHWSQQQQPHWSQQQQPHWSQQQQLLAGQLAGFATVTSGLPQEMSSSLPGPTVTSQVPGRLIKPSPSGSSSGGPGSNSGASWPHLTPPPATASLTTITTGLPEDLAGPAAASPSPPAGAAAAAAHFVPAAAGKSSAGIAAATAAAAAPGYGSGTPAAAAGTAGPDATAMLLQLDPELLLSGASQQWQIMQLEQQMASLMARLSVLHAGHTMTLINVLNKKQLAVAAVHSYPLVLDMFAVCKALEGLGLDQPEASEAAGAEQAGAADNKTILLVPLLATAPVMPLPSAANLTSAAAAAAAGTATTAITAMAATAATMFSLNPSGAQMMGLSPAAAVGSSALLAPFAKSVL